MVTFDNVQEALRVELNNLFCKGEQSGWRDANEMLPRNPDQDIEKSVEKLSSIIDQFFLDNR